LDGKETDLKEKDDNNTTKVIFLDPFFNHKPKNKDNENKHQLPSTRRFLYIGFLLSGFQFFEDINKDLFNLIDVNAKGKITLDEIKDAVKILLHISVDLRLKILKNQRDSLASKKKSEPVKESAQEGDKKTDKKTEDAKEKPKEDSEVEHLNKAIAHLEDLAGSKKDVYLKKFDADAKKLLEEI